MTEPTGGGRVNIALTGPAEIAKDAIRDRFPFEEGQQVIRVGLAYAIRCELQPVRGQGFGKAGDGQNQNVGSFDPTGDIRSLMAALYPDAADPYVIAETLMSLGLVKLWEDLQSGAVTHFADLMYTPAAAQL
ncbi:MAG: hypothetical protein JWM02_1320 [Frankiales bacterium]|nr:hypothetical protein [Frankiales bacterium]